MLAVTVSFTQKEMIELLYLSHFERYDFRVMSGSSGDLPIIQTKNSRLVGSNAVRFDAIIAELCLVLAQSNAGYITTVVFGSKGSKGSPTTTNVQESVSRLEVKFLADDGKLVVLEFLKGFFTGEVEDDTGRVDHSVTKEPVEIENNSKRGRTLGTKNRNHLLLQTDIIEGKSLKDRIK